MLADASIGKIYFLNMWDDSAFRTYYGRMGGCNLNCVKACS